jgi:hypothetical protein
MPKLAQDCTFRKSQKRKRHNSEACIRSQASMKVSDVDPDGSPAWDPMRCASFRACLRLRMAKLRDADVLTEDVSQEKNATYWPGCDRPGSSPQALSLDPRRKTEVRGASLQVLQEVVDVLRSKGAGEVAVGPGVAVDGRDRAEHVHA